MVSAIRGVWAIDIGSNALKALCMRQGDVGLEVIDFAYMEHSVNLSSGGLGDVEKDQILSETLHKFLEEKDLTKSDVAISIAGQNSFTRFINLPPVEAKKIPEVVQFEAVQQIPFDINEVEWDWQLMEAEDSPNKRVGLFAIKNELIAEVMDHFTKENLRVSCVQISPMALYNYAIYDMKELQQSDRNAVVILDIGAENTTLVVCTKDTVWQRSIRIGGNTFTEAIADAFKKNYATAEKLKRTAPMSKYMRQIYTAMKSTYTDLGSEIQRSLGFYTSSPEGRDKTLSKVIALGGGMKLQGLSKYLTQTLGLQVIKPDSFEKLTLAPDISTAKFHENVSDFAIAYGLGVQLLEDAKIRTNLLPRKIARAMMWTQKARVFTIAASILLLVMVLGLGKSYKDLSQHNSHQQTRNEINGVVAQVQDVSSRISEQKNRLTPLKEEINKQLACFQYRETVPLLIETLAKCLPSKQYNPDQAMLYDAFESGKVEEVLAVPRPERKQLFVTRFAMDFSRDLEKADFPKIETSRPGYRAPRRRRTMPGMMDPDMMMDMDMMEGGGYPAGSMQYPGSTAGLPGDATQQGPKTGFTILIEGYSPYRNLSELLDPPSVGDDQSRWGFATRLGKLAVLFPDVPFELLGKDISHFDVDTGLVDLTDSDMPEGIGILKEVERVPKELTETRPGAARGMMEGYGGARADFVPTENVLVDPMTSEEISRTYDIVTQKDIDSNPQKWTEQDLGRIKYNPLNRDELFIDHDRWFRIKAKFVWKDAPKVETPAMDAGGMPMGFE
ncbi:MAG: type IV pilus assembly protein PilM [Phycisphaerae bacterium]|nr:type IV pilus assembly protein PilM [Phycisphaerae bacterium]